jgi:hypothetical protein
MACLLFFAPELKRESLGSEGGIAKYLGCVRIGDAVEIRSVGAELSQVRKLGCGHEIFPE